MGATHDDDHDAQRAMERHALLNVYSLARRLGYSDAIDRHGDKFVIISISAIVFFIVSAIAVSMMMSRPDPRAQERLRCELEARISLMSRERDRLKAVYPELTQADLEARVRVTDPDIQAGAARRCST